MSLENYKVWHQTIFFPKQGQLKTITYIKLWLFKVQYCTQGWIYIWVSMGCSPGALRLEGPSSSKNLIFLFIDIGGGGGGGGGGGAWGVCVLWTYIMKDPQILLVQGPLKA